MHTKQLVGALLLLTLLTLSSLPLVHTAGGNFHLVTVYWGDGRPAEASPGGTETLSIVLRYELDYAFTGLVAALQVPDGFAAVGGGDTITLPYPTPIASGTVITLTFPVFLTEDCAIGNHTATLTLEYKRSRYVTSKDTLDIPVEVTGRPTVRLTPREDAVYEGKQTIWIEAMNTGDAVAHTIELEAAAAAGVAIKFPASAALGALDPDASVHTPVEIIVPPGARGTLLPVPIDVSYVGPRNVLYHHTEKLLVLVKSAPSPPLTPTLTPTELTIGARTPVTVTLTNEGNHPLANLALTLSPDATVKILSDQTLFHYESLPPASSVSVTLEIYVPTATVVPTASLTLQVTYFDDAVWLERSERYTLNFLLRGLIDISLTDRVVIPAEPRVGNPFSATITVTNVGTSTAYAASAAPDLANLPLKTFGPASVYIGNIDLNLPTTFTINLLLDNTTATEILLPVTLTYMDNLRQPYTIVFTIPVTIAPPVDESSGTAQGPPSLPFRGTLLLIGVTAIGAVSVIVLWRRRRSRGEQLPQ